VPLGAFARRLAIALLAFDAGFVLAHVAYVRGIEPFGGNSQWSLLVDRSYPEMFGYRKLAVAAVLLLVLAGRGPKLLYLTWSLIVLVILADDAARLHEEVGRWIASTLDLSDALGLRGQDLGELLFWAIIGIVLLGLLAIAHVHITGQDRWRSAGLFGCLLLLGVFGVVIDMVHVLLANHDRAGRIAGTIEDGGELMVLTILVVYVVRLVTLTATAMPPDPDVVPPTDPTTHRRVKPLQQC
jgi:hypothetical protein